MKYFSYLMFLCFLIIRLWMENYIFKVRLLKKSFGEQLLSSTGYLIALVL